MRANGNARGKEAEEKKVEIEEETKMVERRKKTHIETRGRGSYLQYQNINICCTSNQIFRILQNIGSFGSKSFIIPENDVTLQYNGYNVTRQNLQNHVIPS